jgi:HPt (histidine-containing phosphotransfer) domain-containing protein
MIDENVIAVLRASLSDDGTVIRQLIDLYASDSPQQLANAAAALAQQDVEALTRAAHSLKSTSASMGATTVSEVSRELEQLAKQGDLAQSAIVLERLKLEVNSAINAFTQLKLKS